MSLVTTESHVNQCNEEALKGFKQWKDMIKFQETAMAVMWSVVCRQPRLDQGEWLGNGYIIQAVNEKLGWCRREGR